MCLITMRGCRMYTRCITVELLLIKYTILHQACRGSLYTPVRHRVHPVHYLTFNP